MIYLDKFIEAVRYVLAPPFCFYCRDSIYRQDSRASSRVLCARCAQLIKPIISTRIDLGNGWVMPVHSACAYEEPIKSLILAKNRSDYVASKQLARIMWDFSMAKHIPFDFLMPLPSHWTRTAQRGYNQAEVIAKELSVLSKKPLLQGLKRIRRTKKQAECPVSERAKNVAHAFALASDAYYIKDAIIVMVDDLMTTGASLCAAGKELIGAQPKEIYALVAARVI